MPRDMYHYIEDAIEDILDISVKNSAQSVILTWAGRIRLNLTTPAGGQAVCDGLAAALESWADPAVAACFAACFFPPSTEMQTSIVAKAKELSRGWEDRDKAADFAAAAFTVEFEDRQKRLRTGRSDEWEGLFEREYSPHSSTKKQGTVDPVNIEFWANLAPVAAELDEKLDLVGNIDEQTPEWIGYIVKGFYSQIAEMAMRPGDFY